MTNNHAAILNIFEGRSPDGGAVSIMDGGAVAVMEQTFAVRRS
ncbi:MAG: hypothetical protein WDO70_01655 [Alphaproteobacteria bacterium]